MVNLPYFGVPCEAHEVEATDIQEMMPPADYFDAWQNGDARSWPPPPENPEPGEPPDVELRFKVGDRVECCIACCGVRVCGDILQPDAQFVRGAPVVACRFVSAVSSSLSAGPAHLRAASPQFLLRTRTQHAPDRPSYTFSSLPRFSGSAIHVPFLNFSPQLVHRVPLPAGPKVAFRRLRYRSDLLQWVH